MNREGVGRFALGPLCVLHVCNTAKCMRASNHLLYSAREGHAPWNNEEPSLAEPGGDAWRTVDAHFWACVLLAIPRAPLGSGEKKAKAN